MKLELIHTGSEEIKHIHENGVFGSFLFFSDTEYWMTQADVVYVYQIEIDEDELIDVDRMFFDHSYEEVIDIIEEVAERFEVDFETAAGFIDESINPYDHGCDGDDRWAIQLYTAKAAKKLGYRGVIVSDEQGAAYMIEMLGQEDQLKLIATRDRRG